jgi:hypothetical protein
MEKLMSWILDMLLDMSFVGFEKNLHKVIEHIFLYDLLCIFAISALMIFVAKCK